MKSLNDILRNFSSKIQKNRENLRNKTIEEIDTKFIKKDSNIIKKIIKYFFEILSYIILSFFVTSLVFTILDAFKIQPNEYIFLLIGIMFFIIILYNNIQTLKEKRILIKNAIKNKNYIFFSIERSSSYYETFVFQRKEITITKKFSFLLGYFNVKNITNEYLEDNTGNYFYFYEIDDIKIILEDELEDFLKNNFNNFYKKDNKENNINIKNDIIKYYNILNLKPTATLDEIKKAYKIKLMQYHPDKNNNDENSHRKTIEIIEAYKILSNHKKV